jgi:hypothetical protein
MMAKGLLNVARERSAKRRVTVGLSDLAVKALVGEEADGGSPPSLRTEHALRCYLGDRGTDRPAWPYPDFLRGAEARGDRLVEFDVEEELWLEFEAAASAQGVSVEQLAEHAAFYFAAELNAGRLTQRILEDLEDDGGDERL